MPLYSTIELCATIIFALAIIHTFSASQFEHLAHTHRRHAGLFHLLGEVETVFGVWAAVLIIVYAIVESNQVAIEYLDTRNYAEPLLVFVLMVMAASKPMVVAAQNISEKIAGLLPMNPAVSRFFVILSVVPMLGSFITEPAAMTLAALLLREQFMKHQLPEAFKYGVIGVLFVNISIGGTLTPFAAPPVLMVAAKWGWGIDFMITQIGWRAALAVFINAAVLTMLGRKFLDAIPVAPKSEQANDKIPLLVTLIHVGFLAGAVIFHHHPVVFMGLFLFFLGYTTAYPQFQSRLLLREALLVAFFLAGLVVLGGMQKWWLQDLLAGMSPNVLYFAATALTAITDNAAITYLGSLVDGTSDAFKYALVTGAVTGGGLTVIANAPNPAGYSLLKETFREKSISAGGLFLAALPPTFVAICTLWFLP